MKNNTDNNNNINHDNDLYNSFKKPSIINNNITKAFLFYFVIVKHFFVYNYHSFN